MPRKRNKRKNHRKQIEIVIRARKGNQANQNNQSNNKIMIKRKQKKLKKYKWALKQKTTEVEST